AEKIKQCIEQVMTRGRPHEHIQPRSGTCSLDRTVGKGRMKITRGYKTELDPTVKQHILLCQCAGTARFAYNYGLARKQEVYKESGQSISGIDLQKELTARKHADLPWLRRMSKWIVQNALRDLDDAY